MKYTMSELRGMLGGLEPPSYRGIPIPSILLKVRHPYMFCRHGALPPI